MLFKKFARTLLKRVGCHLGVKHGCVCIHVQGGLTCNQCNVKHDAWLRAGSRYTPLACHLVIACTITHMPSSSRIYITAEMSTPLYKNLILPNESIAFAVSLL